MVALRKKKEYKFGLVIDYWNLLFFCRIKIQINQYD